MRYETRWLVILGLLPCVAGCGGTTSQKDMMRMAISRPKDDEESQPVAAKPSAAADQGNSVAIQKAGPSPRTDNETAASGEPLALGNPNRPATEANDSAANSSNVSGTSPTRVLPQGPVEETEDAYVERLGRLGDAFSKYLAEKKALPAYANKANNGRPLLSWRVHLLPYLGYSALYAQFILDEPWDSPQNLSLLEQMPVEYYSGAGQSGHTCVQVPLASYAAFNGQRTVLLTRIEDGVGNTAAVVMVDSAQAVPWTKPQDYSPPERNPVEGLALFNNDHYLILWASGRVAKITSQADLLKYRAMLTIDAGETFFGSELNYLPEQVATAEPQSGTPAIEPTSTDAGRTEGRPTNPVAVASADAAPKSASSLADDLMTIVMARLDEAQYEHTFDLLDLSLLVNPNDRLPLEMKWLPAINRPVIMPRVGIGIECPLGPRFRDDPEPYREERRATKRRGDQGSQLIDKYLGDFGSEVVSLMEARIDAGDWGHWAQTEAARPARERGARDQLDSRPRVVRPGIEFLGNNTRRNLMEIATQRGLDVLLFFDVKLSKTRQNVTHNTTRLIVYDVATESPIYHADEVNNIQVYVAKQNPVETDPLAIALNDFDKWVRDKLVLTDLPALTPDEIRARMSHAAEETEGTSWDAALEARLYFKLGLVSRVEYEQWVESFTGVSIQQLLDSPDEQLLNTLLDTRSPEFARLTRESLETPPEAPPQTD